jgi:hypothetical protein
LERPERRVCQLLHWDQLCLVVRQGQADPRTPWGHGRLGVPARPSVLEVFVVVRDRRRGVRVRPAP